jgi:hypothetical protein
VKLYSRPGNDLTYRFPLIVESLGGNGCYRRSSTRIVEARTSRGVSRVMLFSKAIIQAEWAADAPFREAMAIKRERLRTLRAKRAAK